MKSVKSVRGGASLTENFRVVYKRSENVKEKEGIPVEKRTVKNELQIVEWCFVKGRKQQNILNRQKELI